MNWFFLERVKERVNDLTRIQLTGNQSDILGLCLGDNYERHGAAEAIGISPRKADRVLRRVVKKLEELDLRDRGLKECGDATVYLNNNSVPRTRIKK